LAYEGGKNDDNKKRVTVPGSAKRVATLKIEGEKIAAEKCGQMMIFKM